MTSVPDIDCTMDEDAVPPTTRAVVKHNYEDHYNDPLHCQGNTAEPRRQGPRGGVIMPFPCRLHEMLNQINNNNDYRHVISWKPHGRCFVIHAPKIFVKKIMPKYFKMTKFTSFQRQVNLYGFRRLTRGRDRGGYYHEFFLQGRSDLCKLIFRMRIKGNRTKALPSPATEPNFYAMEPCLELKTPRTITQKDSSSLSSPLPRDIEGAEHLRYRENEEVASPTTTFSDSTATERDREDRSEDEETVYPISVTISNQACFPKRSLEGMVMDDTSKERQETIISSSNTANNDNISIEGYPTTNVQSSGQTEPVSFECEKNKVTLTNINIPKIIMNSLASSLSGYSVLSKNLITANFDHPKVQDNKRSIGKSYNSENTNHDDKKDTGTTHKKKDTDCFHQIIHNRRCNSDSLLPYLPPDAALDNCCTHSCHNLLQRRPRPIVTTSYVNDYHDIIREMYSSRNGNTQLQSGDRIFFEGRPFHYIEAQDV